MRPLARCIEADFPLWTPCGYCYQEWATVWDHVIPRSRGGKSTRDNLEPACYRCNRMLAARVFESLRDKKEWVRTRLIKQGVWRFPEEDAHSEEVISETPPVETYVSNNEVVERPRRDPREAYFHERFHAPLGDYHPNCKRCQQMPDMQNTPKNSAQPRYRSLSERRSQARQYLATHQIS